MKGTAANSQNTTADNKPICAELNQALKIWHIINKCSRPVIINLDLPILVPGVHFKWTPGTFLLDKNGPTLIF